ncbi:hypothetical protein PG993_004758 [Apiospora rasikravindrae]|uniref:Apple domain-containing protein n=1 Tax=Apiospora rasikravindrae TaxID=990691 RepID=A0ABR1TG77_9PEZI
MDDLDSSIAVPNLSGNGAGTLWPGTRGAEVEAPLSPRASSSSPCPDANNTKIADSKGMEYNILCGTSIIGSDVGSPAPADSLANCLDLCTKTQGTCAGVTYNGTHCHRKDFVGPSAIKPTVSLSGNPAENNSAVAIVPPPSAADCISLKSCYQSSSSSSGNQQHGFQIYCGQDYKRDDLSKVFAASMTQCLDACANAASQGCVGVAYQSGSRGNGVLNCYLKNGTDTEYLVDGRGYDTSAAFMLSASTNGGSCPSSSSTTTTSSGETQEGIRGRIVVVVLLRQALPPESSSLPSSGAGAGTIAGAAVGGVAGLAILCLLVFMFVRRRQRRRMGSNTNNINNDNGGGPAPNPNYLQAPSPSSKHLATAPSSSGNFSNFTEGYAGSTPPTDAGVHHPQQQQQKPPETLVQPYYEVDASPRAVEVEAPMDQPTEMADQSVWSNHEPKTRMRMR